jgi:hypothetical protein
MESGQTEHVGRTGSAVRSGQGIGRYGALRSAIARFDDVKKVVVTGPLARDDYKNATEAHDRGVSAGRRRLRRLDIYCRRSADLIRLANLPAQAFYPTANGHIGLENLR